MENKEMLALDAALLERLNALAKEENTTVEALLERLFAYLPLLCRLDKVCAGEYAAFAEDYGKLIGAEDGFLCTMGYEDYTGGITLEADSLTILRGILGVGMLNGAAANGVEGETAVNNATAAVSALL